MEWSNENRPVADRCIQVDPRYWVEVLQFLQNSPNCEVVNTYGDDGRFDIIFRHRGLVNFISRGDWIVRLSDGVIVYETVDDQGFFTNTVCW
jgi:hypothetical protein